MTMWFQPSQPYLDFTWLAQVLLVDGVRIAHRSSAPGADRPEGCGSSTVRARISLRDSAAIIGNISSLLETY
jgi:hypothetical protein